MEEPLLLSESLRVGPVAADAAESEREVRATARHPKFPQDEIDSRPAGAVAALHGTASTFQVPAIALSESGPGELFKRRFGRFRQSVMRGVAQIEICKNSRVPSPVKSRSTAP